MPQKKPEVCLSMAKTRNNEIIISAKSSNLDRNLFNEITSFYPCIFGDITAIRMVGKEQLPLRNRPNGIILDSCGTKINGVNVYKNIKSAIGDFRHFDKIFICGGVQTYINSMNETLNGQPLVDTIVKTILPDGYIKSDKHLDDKTVAQMSAPNFELTLYQDYDLHGDYYVSTDCWTKETGSLAPYSAKIPVNKNLGQNDIAFPDIRLEIWKRNQTRTK